MKKSEAVNSEAIIPSLVQLRHAGTHLLRGLCATGDSDFSESIASAHRHCDRAVFDAAEAELMEYLEQFDRFKNDYNLIQINPIFPEYKALRAVVREANQILESAPIDRNDRWKKANLALDVRSRLEPLIQQMDDAREDLNKELERQDKEHEKAQRESRQKWIVLAIGVPAAIAAIITIYKFVTRNPEITPSTANATTAAPSPALKPAIRP